MPSVKQGGGYTLTFSKKNYDVRDHLEKLKKDDKVKITDYLCDAVRFYENNKNSSTNVNTDLYKIENLIESKFTQLSNMISNLSSSNSANNDELKLKMNAKKVGGFAK